MSTKRGTREVGEQGVQWKAQSIAAPMVERRREVFFEEIFPRNAAKAILKRGDVKIYAHVHGTKGEYVPYGKHRAHWRSHMVLFSRLVERLRFQCN